MKRMEFATAFKQFEANFIENAYEGDRIKLIYETFQNLPIEKFKKLLDALLKKYPRRNPPMVKDFELMRAELADLYEQKLRVQNREAFPKGSKKADPDKANQFFKSIQKILD